MITLLQTVTILLLVGWPAYNLVVAVVGMVGTRPGRRATGDASSLRFWIMIPALNEERVIHRTVTAALALEGPGGPPRVLVIDDGSSDGTAAILAAIDDPRLEVLSRKEPDARRGKGEALNAGYRRIVEIAEAEGTVLSTVVGIVDGDGRCDDRVLHEVGALLTDRGVGAVQCRVRIHNRDRILGLLQDLEFGCIANASQSLRDRLGSVGMGGNGQFVRLGDLTQLGPSPWSDCLVEDLELGIRLHLAGVRIRYTSRASISQQAVVDLSRLVRQRARWAQGNLQCARYLPGLSASRRIGTVALLDFVYYLLAPWFTVPLTLFVLAAMGFAVVGLSTGETFGGLTAGREAATWAVGLWAVVLVLPGLLWGLVHWWRLGDEPLRRCLVAGLAFPGFLVLGVFATWRAVVRHARGRRSWAKTERSAEAPVLPEIPAPREPVEPVPAEHR
ncbi:glycosyltransferase family 2 protein [Pseudonocardia pini]|uniref:glycosyltransferase family 2 protein n=1 Tax=Pseudonocardia pini TaxID=2758030 RepID=UPI0015F105F8|nr:glycosyltransferase [Pseudonocardia pini]